MAKNGFLAFALRLAYAVGAKVNVPFVGRHKIELKKCAVGKIQKGRQ